MTKYLEYGKCLETGETGKSFEYRNNDFCDRHTHTSPLYIDHHYLMISKSTSSTMIHRHYLMISKSSLSSSSLSNDLKINIIIIIL